MGSMKLMPLRPPQSGCDLPVAYHGPQWNARACLPYAGGPAHPSPFFGEPWGLARANSAPFDTRTISGLDGYYWVGAVSYGGNLGVNPFPLALMTNNGRFKDGGGRLWLQGHYQLGTYYYGTDPSLNFAAYWDPAQQAMIPAYQISDQTYPNGNCPAVAFCPDGGVGHYVIVQDHREPTGNGPDYFVVRQYGGGGSPTLYSSSHTYDWYRRTDVPDPGAYHTPTGGRQFGLQGSAYDAIPLLNYKEQTAIAGRPDVGGGGGVLIADIGDGTPEARWWEGSPVYVFYQGGWWWALGAGWWNYDTGFGPSYRTSVPAVALWKNTTGIPDDPDGWTVCTTKLSPWNLDAGRGHYVLNQASLGEPEAGAEASSRYDAARLTALQAYHGAHYLVVGHSWGSADPTAIYRIDGDVPLFPSRGSVLDEICGGLIIRDEIDTLYHLAGEVADPDPQGARFRLRLYRLENPGYWTLVSTSPPVHCTPWQACLLDVPGGILIADGQQIAGGGNPRVHWRASDDSWAEWNDDCGAAAALPVARLWRRF